MILTICGVDGFGVVFVEFVIDVDWSFCCWWCCWACANALRGVDDEPELFMMRNFFVLTGVPF